MGIQIIEVKAKVKGERENEKREGREETREWLHKSGELHQIGFAD